jgi:6-pyruvoyltetrahydropterin/6-carboxytetrahydropterin synthase
MKTIIADRYHDISCGHRVVGHESKCRFIHGHNYRVHFRCEGPRDDIGRVLDFSVIKSKLCMWLEDNWDHRFLAFVEDPLLGNIMARRLPDNDAIILIESVVWVPFNPTAENMADYLLTVVGPRLLEGTGVNLISVRVEETRKCSAEVSL